MQLFLHLGKKENPCGIDPHGKTIFELDAGDGHTFDFDRRTSDSVIPGFEIVGDHRDVFQKTNEVAGDGDERDGLLDDAVFNDEPGRLETEVAADGIGPGVRALQVRNQQTVDDA